MVLVPLLYQWAYHAKSVIIVVCVVCNWLSLMITFFPSSLHSTFSTVKLANRDEASSAYQPDFTMFLT